VLRVALDSARAASCFPAFGDAKATTRKGNAIWIDAADAIQKRDALYNPVNDRLGFQPSPPPMLTFRTFRNTDPPALAAIWRSRAGQSGLAEHISPALLEELVFAKPYFDYNGLILAWDDNRPVGFAHAGFGPDATGAHISTELGVTCLAVVRPDTAESEVAAGLLQRSEQYLARRGAKAFYGGGIRPLTPFYLGLYDGSDLPGVLHEDIVAQELFRSHGYEEVDQTLLFRRELVDFHAVTDRRQMQIRRQMITEVTADPPARNWWEACTLSEFDLTRFELISRGSGPPAAWATFRSMEPSGTLTAGRVAGLIELGVEPSHRRRGLAIFLLSEAFRQFLRQGIGAVETQTVRRNVDALGVFEKMGFEQIGQGSVFRKQAGGE
jgi:GNAT superfamily N-acetyltransferase